jgi:3-oxoacyl-[acyl-carrier protein] reductase
VGDRVAGKVALVTGAASGIGAGCAHRLGTEGARVVLADLPTGAGEQTAARLRDDGVECRFMATDVRDPAACEAAVSACVETYGGLDVVVAAAGISHGSYLTDDGSPNPRTPLVEVDPEDWHRVLAVNLDGVMHIDQAAARWMLAAGVRGSIVNVASMNAVRTSPGTGPYSVSKAAAWMLTKSYAVELAGAGIRVNAVGPGFVETPMTDRLFRIDPKYRERMMAATPLGRMGRPADIAAAVLYLAGDEAEFVTGTLLVVDGGFMAAER